MLEIDDREDLAEDVELPPGRASIEASPLPHDWQLVRLDSVARLTSGGTPSKGRPDWWAGPIPWASPKDLKRLRLADTQDHISEEALREGSRLVPAGSLFVVVRGMILARDLPVAIAEVPMAFNQDMKAILPSVSIDAEYLLYALIARKGELVREIGTAAHGTRRLGTSALEAFTIPRPPLPEQRAIARVLRTVQRAREATDAVLAATRALKRSLMRHIFTYGPGVEPLPTRETQFGQVPASWDMKPLSDCAVVQTGVTMGRKIEDRRSLTLPYLRVANVQDGYLDLSEVKHIRIRESEVDRYSLQLGDVLLTEGGDFDKLGRGFIWRGHIPRAVHQNVSVQPRQGGWLGAGRFCKLAA